MTPTIAIPKLGPGLLRRYLGAKYVSALTAAGAVVRWIDMEHVAAAAECDGLLIPGGDDIHPGLYGQAISEKCGKQNPLRDEIDPVILDVFLKTGKPILGVCRGIQMLNVHFGGTLYQDIKDSQTISHSDFRHRSKERHTVSIEENTLLHKILGCSQISVNTIHHQAVDRLGQGLVVSARSPDGFVEALEWPEHRFFLGVQWHPELMQHHDAQMKIITAFVDACRN